MSVTRSASTAFTTFFDTITRIFSAADKGVDIAYTYVNEAHYRQKTVSTTQMIKDTARELREITAELDEDENLKSQFDAVKADYAAYCKL